MKWIARVFCVTVFILWAAPLWAENLSDDEPIKTEAPAATPTLPKPPEEKLITIGVSPFFGIPASSKTATEYNIGGGLEIFISYKANKDLLIGLDLGLQDYSVNNDYFLKAFQQTYGFGLPAGVTLGGDFAYFPLMAMAKVSFGENDKMKPYMLFGFGPAFNTGSASASYQGQSVSVSVHETTLVLAPGFGLAIRAADDLEVFIQGRVDIDFTSQNNSDIVTTTQPGFPTQTTTGNLSDDGPTLFIPIQAGVRFL
jgi:hypothetical protein